MYTMYEGILYTTEDFHKFDQVHFIPTLHQKDVINPQVAIVDITSSPLDYIQQAMYYQNPISRRSSHIIIGEGKDEVVQCVNGSIMATTFREYATYAQFDDIQNKSFNIQVCNRGELYKTQDGFVDSFGIAVEDKTIFEYNGKYYSSLTIHQIETLTILLDQLVKDLELYDVVAFHEVSQREFVPVLNDNVMDAIYPRTWENSRRERSFTISDSSVVYKKIDNDFVTDPLGYVAETGDQVIVLERNGIFWHCMENLSKVTYWMPNKNLTCGSKMKV